MDELGVGFVHFSPLGKGFLTGTINADVELDKTNARNMSPRFSKENSEANQALVDLVVSIAKDKNATPAQIALGWLLAQKPFIVPIQEHQNCIACKKTLVGQTFQCLAMN